MMNEQGQDTLTYRDYLWDKFPELWEKVRQGKRSIKQLYAQFKDQAELHKKLAKSYTDCKVATKDQGQLDGPLARWLEFCTQTAQAHTNVANEIEKSIVKECEAMRKELSKSLDDAKTQEKKMRKELETAEDKAKAAKAKDLAEKKAYEKAWAELQRTEADPQTKPQKLQKAQQSSTKQDQTQRKAEMEYKAAVDKLRETNAKFYRELGELMQRIEELDRKRLAFVKTIMANYSSLHLSCGQTCVQQSQELDASFKAVDIDKDIQDFVSTVKSGLTPPEPASFDPYIVHLDGKPMPNGIDHPDSPVPSSSSTNALKAGIGASSSSSVRASVKNDEDLSSASSQGSIKATNPGASSSSSKKYVEVLYPYTEVAEGELVVQPGDIIAVIEEQEDGWWSGEIIYGSAVGKKGFFPSNYTKPSDGKPSSGGAAAAPATPADDLYSYNAPKPASNTKTVVALYEYAAGDPSELNLKVGDLVTVLEENDDGWYFGSKADGSQGLFPSNYTQPQ